MGIKTKLSLTQAQELFPDLDVLSIHPTHHGVIDTTYVLNTKADRYILKKYERADCKQVLDEEKLLTHLHAKGLNVPRLISVSNGWRLFSYIQGNISQKLDLHNLQSLGQFLGMMHTHTRGKKVGFTPFKQTSFKVEIKRLRTHNPLLARELRSLISFTHSHDGIIHGDLFPDNAKFDDNRLGVFDFIEAGNGSFHFDVGIAAMSWIAQSKKISRARLQIFLKAYNQKAPFKLDLDELLRQMQYAALTYALQRWTNEEQRLDYRQMLNRHARIEHFKKYVA